MTPIQITLAALAILMAVGGAVARFRGTSRVERGLRLAHHWAHPSMQLQRDPDEVIAMTRRGHQMQKTGRRLAMRGIAVSIAGMVLSFIVLLWVVVSQ